MISWIIVAVSLGVFLILGKFHLPQLRFRREIELSKGISTAVEHRGPFMAGTTQEIIEICQRVSEVLDLSKKEQAKLEVSARLCDLGLCGIPSELLLKRTEWTAEEEAIYDRHPDQGAEILSKSKALKSYAKIVRFHHSRFEVVPDAPLESRILCVVSDYVRFKRTMGSERSLLALERQSGTHYDPELVEAVKLAKTS